MNLIRRWTTSIASSFDYVMNQVENHDALVTAAIREMQTSGAKAKVQLERVKRDGERMRLRAQELIDMESAWAERAVRVHEEDKARALECVQRRNQTQRERQVLENQLKEHKRVEEQLIKDLKVIDERIGELKRKKNSYNARQYRAEALKAGQLSELGLIGEIDEIFDRWELKVTQYETSFTEADPLEADFKRDEDAQLLALQLEELLAQNNLK